MNNLQSNQNKFAMSRAFTTDAMLQLEQLYSVPGGSGKNVTPASFLDEALQVVAHNSNHDFRQRLPESAAGLEKWNLELTLPDLTNFASAERAIEKFLLSLGDRHNELRSRSQMKNSLKALHFMGGVSSSRINDKIAYVKVCDLVSRFTGAQFHNAVQALSDADNLILDLRDNRGGYLDQFEEIYSALEVSPETTVYSVKGIESGLAWEERILLTPGNYLSISGKRPIGYPRKTPSVFADKPIVVLVNDETRSAAELLACALSVSERIKLVGRRTYGKDALQQTIPISRGYSLRVTSARFSVTGALSFASFGIKPDVEVGQDMAGDSQLVAAISLLRRGW